MKFSRDNLKSGDKVLLKNRRGHYWNYDGEMDEYMGTIVTIKTLCNDDFRIEEDSRWLFGYEDIERKIINFTLDDLKFADILTLRNDERYVYTDGYIYGEDEDYRLDYERINSFIDKDLKGRKDTNYDIVKVERAGQIIYEREEEIKEMTLSQVCKQLGYEVKIVKEED